VNLGTSKGVSFSMTVWDSEFKDFSVKCIEKTIRKKEVVKCQFIN
jgi:hypothetical protein